jgi:hypothetical protein
MVIRYLTCAALALAAAAVRAEGSAKETTASPSAKLEPGSPPIDEPGSPPIDDILDAVHLINPQQE